MVSRRFAHRARTVVRLDEPTGNLDALTSELVLERMFVAVREHTRAAVVVATHDLGAARYCDRVFVLKDGNLQPWE
ncbi:ABC transporter ATP-binding protein YxdL [bacterium BMS3Bbin02]|nr:ABC transporter ATP-binding protein YxdL [bacterium BMS3Bbin02]